MMIRDITLEISYMMGIYTLFLTAFSLFGFIRTIHSKAAVGYRIGYTFLLICNISAMVISENIYPNYMDEYIAVAIRTFIRNTDIPFFIIIIILILLTIINAGMYINTRRHLRERLSPDSLQHGLDLLPDGIMFADSYGIPILVNDKMHNICASAFGTRVLDGNTIKKRFDDNDVDDNTKIYTQDERRYLELSDGTVWDIRQNYLTISQIPHRKHRMNMKPHPDGPQFRSNNSTIYECIAYDITEQHRKNQEMEVRNARLARINEQIRDYSTYLDAACREKEILASKIKIHDNVGSCLLALRSYLSSENSDRKQLISLWNTAISLLNKETVYDNPDSPLTALKNAASAIDVKLIIDGNIPDDKNIENIVMIAIHECLTNTVKHADGDTLKVNMHNSDDYVNISLCNNGNPPTAPINETGGLKILRRTVEMSGGVMTIECTPEFTLNIQLPYSHILQS